MTSRAHDSDTIFGKVQKVSGDATNGYTLTVALGQAADLPADMGDVRLTTADRIGAFKLPASLLAKAEQHYTARVNLPSLNGRWTASPRPSTLAIATA